ncbi:hypothetical protein [Neobacillus ginsengisoli]|uniref:Sulfotransferase family protein n=1 Tax=Neobacillus ginsengisoli TaxID=904295 RepID=A0ABT9XZ19_9BACI|nr:hypothetical protein [Neobacillus ginsengisoli]MDQ0200822.1 hypothetical protein [Neobacillus ginsengisoli]
MEKRKFLVLGHPRSGTTFSAKLLRDFGYQVGHEAMKDDGISSWMFAVEDNQVFTSLGLNRKDYTFEYIIMNIRNPVDIITSTYFTENTSKKSMNYRKKYVNFEGLNKVEEAVKSVLEWYKLIEMQRPHLKLFIDKNPEEKLFHFLKRFDNKEGLLPIKKIKKKINARKHPDLSLSFIKENCGEELFSELIHFCGLYDYHVFANPK